MSGSECPDQSRVDALAVSESDSTAEPEPEPEPNSKPGASFRTSSDTPARAAVEGAVHRRRPSRPGAGLAAVLILLVICVASFFWYREVGGPQPFWQSASTPGEDSDGELDVLKPVREVEQAVPDGVVHGTEAAQDIDSPLDSERAIRLLLPVVVRARPVLAALPPAAAREGEAEFAARLDAEEALLVEARPAVEAIGPSVAPVGAIQVHFDFDSSTLDEGSRRSLELAAHMMERAGPAAKARISGYADPFGNGDYNLSLSRRRAETVADYMVRLGVPPRRMEVRGLGSLERSGSGDAERPVGGVDAQRLVRVEIIPDTTR